MARGIVGVDIGSESIRAVEVSDAGGSQPTIVRYHEVALPEGAAKSGDVLEVHSVASALQRLWVDGGFKSKDVVLGMGNQRVLARNLTVPKMTMKQIRESLPFQVQEMLPVPVSEAILDFYPVAEETSENGPVIRGLLVAAVKEAVMANVTAAQLAGLKPVAVDLIPFALSRVHLRGSSAAGTVALIDVGSTTINVVIATDGVPQFVRIIPAGSDEISSALIAKLGMTPATAEQAKRAIGVVTAGVSPEHRPVLEVIYEVTGQLLNGLRNTLNYFVNAHQYDSIDRIILSGGGSRMPGFEAALAELTHVPVSMDTGFRDLKLARTMDSADVAARADMTVALGLALGSKA